MQDIIFAHVRLNIYEGKEMSGGNITIFAALGAIPTMAVTMAQCQ